MADIIDINVLEIVEDVTINVVDNVIQVNINKVTNVAVTNTSELINDGEDGVHPYITLLDLPSNLILYPTTVASDVSGYVKLVTDIHDPEYNSTAVNVSTGSITTTNQLISSLITVPNLINGNPGVFNISTIGNIRRTAGSGTAEFYFNIYKRDSLGVETLIGVSNPTLPSSSAVYAEFNSTAIWDDGIFVDTDRIVLKFYANRISGGSNPTYEFQFGGLTPVRTLVPIPLSVVPNNQTLQQVTDAGNVTTNPIFTGNIKATDVNGGDAPFYGKYNSANGIGNIILEDVSSNNLHELRFIAPTGFRQIDFKNESGTVAFLSDIPAPITIDATPTDGSTNAVSSNGVFDALTSQNMLQTYSMINLYRAGFNSIFSIGTTLGPNLSNPTVRTLTNTNTYTRSQRIGNVSLALAGSVTNYRITSLHFILDGLSYFEQTIGTAEGSTTTNMRAVYGMSISGAAVIGNIEYNTLTDFIGLVRLSGSNNWHVLHNDNTGTATTIDLGASFPANVVDEKYTFRITPLSTTSCDFKVTRQSTGVSVTNTLTTDLPSLNQLFTFRGGANNNTNAVAFGWDFFAVTEKFN